MGIEQFYCVKCCELKSMEDGRIVFKTGYFRIVYPLGCCEACRADEIMAKYTIEAEQPAVSRPSDRIAASSASGSFHSPEWAVV